MINTKYNQLSDDINNHPKIFPCQKIISVSEYHFKDYLQLI